MSALIGAALALGVSYALLGAAVAVVARTTRTLQLAVGQVALAGVLVALVLASAVIAVPTVLAVLAGLAVGAGLSAVLGPLILERLPRGLAWLVGLVVVAGTLDAVLVRVFGAVTLRPAPLLPLPPVAGIDPAVVVAVGLGLPAVVGLAWLAGPTRLGRRLRLVGGSDAAAVRAGVDPAHLRAGALAIGGAAAVLAGLLAAPILFVGPAQAAGLTVRGIAAAVLVGRGSPGWAVAGGLLLGAAEAFGSSVWPAAGGEVAVAALVVGLLAWRGGEHLTGWGRAW